MPFEPHREQANMSTLPVIILVSLTLFTWAVAIWASVGEEQAPPEERPPKEEPGGGAKAKAGGSLSHGRKVA